MTVLDAAGAGVFMTGRTIFFTQSIGLSPGQIASGLSIAGVIGLVASVPLGALADRVGHRTAWITLTALQAVLFTLYIYVHSFVQFVVILVVLACTRAGIMPAKGAYLSVIATPEQRTAARAYNRAMFNGGFSIGALGAGVLISHSTSFTNTLTVIANSVSYLLVAAILLTLPARARTVPPAEKAKLTGALRHRWFLLLSMLDGLLSMYITVVTVALPLWIIERTPAHRWTVSGVFLISTLVGLALQVRASRGTDTVSGAAKACARAGLLLLVACLLVAPTASTGSLVADVGVLVAAAVFTLGEVLQSAGSWGLSFGIAPENHQGSFLGVFQLGLGLQDVVGPLLVVSLTLSAGWFGWIVLGISFALVGVVIGPVSRRAQEEIKQNLGVDELAEAAPR